MSHPPAGFFAPIALSLAESTPTLRPAILFVDSGEGRLYRQLYKGYRSGPDLRRANSRKGAGSLEPYSRINSDELPLNGIHDRFQTIMSSQLLINVMEVIPKSLRADTENVSDVFTVFTLRKPA